MKPAAKPKKPRLKRALGLLDVFCIASGAMISSGIFVLPGIAFAKAGPVVCVSYLIAGIFAVPAMFSSAELVTAMPKAGGTYFVIERSFGSQAGTLGGISSWFSISLKAAFALFGIGAFATLLFPGLSILHIKLIAAAFCLFFMALNISSVKHAGRFQVGLVAVLFVLLFYYVIRGFPHVDVHHLHPFTPFGVGSVFATAGLVFISYGGLTKIAGIAEEVENPGRNIPLGMILSIVIVTILYSVVVLVTVGVLPAADLSHSLTPISLGAHEFMGPIGLILLAVAAIAAFVSTANAGIMTASRDPLAMSRDGLLPQFLKRLTKRGTPYISIIITSLFMICAILFLDLETLIKEASILLLFLFIFVNLSVILMRESKVANYRPKFRSPLYPWVQIAGVAGYGFLIYEMSVYDKKPFLIALVFLAVSFLVYLFYGRSHTKRTSAFIHLVERLTARELATPSLGAELKEILWERDNIIEDRFDRLIKNCTIMDLEGPISLEDFCRQVSHEMSKKLGVEPEEFYKKLMERERESTTALRPGLAIPHIIVEGESKFEIVLARCKAGIIFAKDAPSAHAVFALAGSQDERNFHLRVLMAIAQITEDPRFDERWLEARDKEALRDIILLSKRRREGERE